MGGFLALDLKINKDIKNLLALSSNEFCTSIEEMSAVKSRFETMFEGLLQMKEWLLINNYSQSEIDLLKKAIVGISLYRVCRAEFEKFLCANFMDDMTSFEFKILKDSIDIASNNQHDCRSLFANKKASRIACVLCDLDLYPYTAIKEEFFKDENVSKVRVVPHEFLVELKSYLHYLDRSNIFNTEFGKKRWQKIFIKNLMDRLSKVCGRMSGFA